MRRIDHKGFSPPWINKGGSFGRVTNCSADLTNGGDSGGPVFQGSTAAGIISGLYSDNFCNQKKQSIFGVMGYVTDWLGVRVF